MKVSPTLPCVACRGQGYFLGESTRGCTACNGFGKRLATMDEVRKAYTKLREIIAKARGMALEDIDEQTRLRVEKVKLLREPQPAVWFDALFFFARDLDLLDSYWLSGKAEKKAKT